jgi:transposase
MQTDKLRRRPKVHYSEEFKRQIVEEYFSTGVSKDFLQHKYDIRAKSGILRWIRSLGYLRVKEKVGNLGLTNSMILAKSIKKEPAPQDAQAEITRLKRALEDERLRSQLYLRMIEIAEQEYHIPIRKKSGTK